MRNIAVIIMASGLSRRMGTNKLTLKIKGTPIYEHMIKKIEKIDFAKKIVVTSYEEIKIYTKKFDDIILLENENNHLGQAESIKLGVSFINANIDGYMFLPCDMPFIDEKTIIKITDFFYENKNCIVVPQTNGKNSMPTIFPIKYRNDLLKLSGDMGGRDIIKNNMENVRFIEIEDELLLMDIDTKEDYYKYKDY